MKINKYDYSIIDAIIIVILVILIAHFLTKYDGFEELIYFVKKYEDYELDELILVLIIGCFGGIIYSIRRYLELKKIKSSIENLNIKLQNDNEKKDELLYHQNKMAALGEMIQNISHQWRQPLSVISTTVSGLKLDKEFEQLSDENLDKSLDNIMLITRHLSETIDNFKNYTKNDLKLVSFSIDENIKTNLKLLNAQFKISQIEVILDLNSSDYIDGFPNDLTQVFINIINNAKDALEINKIEEKYIFISTKSTENNIFISIQDNAKGVENLIKDKIFEPYFTTKHDFFGTGLGLYMSYKIVYEKFGGDILVENVNYKYNEKNLTGAKFTITIPRK